MKKTLMIFIILNTLLSLGNAYQINKNANIHRDHVNMVLSPLFDYHYKRMMCIENSAVERDEIFERILNLPWAKPIDGPLDTTICDSAMDALHYYEKSKLNFLNKYNAKSLEKK